MLFADRTERDMQSKAIYFGLAVGGSIYHKFEYRREFVDERRLSMRFQRTGVYDALIFKVAHTTTEGRNDSALLHSFWQTLHHLALRILTKEYLFILIDANTRTGTRVKGGGYDKSKVLRDNGCDVLTENGKRVLIFAANKMYRSHEHIVCCARKGGISYCVDVKASAA